MLPAHRGSCFLKARHVGSSTFNFCGGGLAVWQCSKVSFSCSRPHQATRSCFRAGSSAKNKKAWLRRHMLRFGRSRKSCRWNVVCSAHWVRCVLEPQAQLLAQSQTSQDQATAKSAACNSVETYRITTPVWGSTCSGSAARFTL